MSANSQSKIYGDANPTLTYATSGYVNGEGATVLTGTPTIGTTATAATNVGTVAITPMLGSLAATNYNFSFTNGSLLITPRAITVNADTQTMTYGSTTPVLTYSVAADGVGTSRGIYGSDVLIGSLATTANSNTNVGSASITQGSLITSSNPNYVITYVPNVVTIMPANLMITGTQVYNGTVLITGSSLTAIGVNGQTFTVGGVADLASKNVQTNQQLADVNGLTLTPNGLALASNYNPISVANTSASVTPLAVTLIAPSISKVYNGGYTYNVTAADLAAMATQLVGGDTVATVSVVFTGNNPNVGTNKSASLNSVTIGDGNGGANYSVALANSNNSQITPASLSIAANNAAKFVIQADTELYNGVVYSGFVNGETASSALSGTLVINRSNASVNASGAYSGVLIPTGLSANNANYNITFVPGNFTIVAANQLLVQITPVTTRYGSTPTYTATAQYLTCSISSCPSNGSVNTIHTLSPAIYGASFNVNDGAGGSAVFTITPAAVTTSGSDNANVGGYQLSTTNVSTVSSNFSNNIVLTGALTIAPLTLSASQLGISGISKVYNGTSAISGLTLASTQASSSILSGDQVSIMGTGTYADANVGTNKSVTIAVGLSGADANNYVLSNSQLNANTGTISQLASVAYTGTSGGNWSNASNWAGGAIPTLGNVANVVIPIGVTVNYDTAAFVGQTPASTITNNGVIAFAGANNFTFSNTISGSGSINQSGVGVLTIAGNNTYSGGTNINGSNLVIGSANAIGAGPISSNGGTLSLASGIVIPALTINGAVNLASNITTIGNQTYNGAVTLGSASAYNLTSTAGNIAFNGTLIANTSTTFLVNPQSLTISALSGRVSFNDTVGASVVDGTGAFISYTTAYLNSHNINDLTVSANSILFAANVTTYGVQTYNGAVLIGDNGSNGATRILLSEDPSITFNGTVNDVIANTHNLVVEAISNVPANAQTASQLPTVTFNGNVGDLAPLASLYVKTGIQTAPAAGVRITDISPDRTIANGNTTIAGNITTAGNQTYIANNINLGNAPTFTTSNGGVITFLPGLTPSGASAISTIGNTPVSLYLNGGSIVGLANTNIVYQELRTPVSNAVVKAVMVPPPYHANAANVLMASVGNLWTYFSTAASANGSVTVTAPVLESINPPSNQRSSGGLEASELKLVEESEEQFSE